MTRETKVRIVGDPDLSAHIAQTLFDHYEFDHSPARATLYTRAKGRSHLHMNAEGVAIYVTIKSPKTRKVAIDRELLREVMKEQEWVGTDEDFKNLVPLITTYIERMETRA